LSRDSLAIRGEGFFGEQVAQLALPAGSYIILAKLLATTGHEISCWLAVGAPNAVIDLVGTATSSVLSLIGQVTLTSPGNPELRCSGQVSIGNLRMTAVPVGSIVQQ